MHICILWRRESDLLFTFFSLVFCQETNACLAASDAGHTTYDWDCSLHLPLWVSENEKAVIGDRLEEWTKQLEATGTDIGSLASTLRKPLRPLWISQKTVIWLNEVPDCDSWNFTPVILVSASSSSGVIQQGTTSEFSWHYIPGAGDDEESWARGLSPHLFWKHVFDLINSGSDFCNRSVADIVEKDRVYRAQRGQNAPQITVKPQKLLPDNEEDSLVSSPFLHSQDSNNHISVGPLVEQCSVSWLGCTNLAVGATRDGMLISLICSRMPEVIFIHGVILLIASYTSLLKTERR